jgi:hypothetical protein
MQFGVTKSDFVLQNRIPQLPMFKAFLAKRETPQPSAKDHPPVCPAAIKASFCIGYKKTLAESARAFDAGVLVLLGSFGWPFGCAATGLDAFVHGGEGFEILG